MSITARKINKEIKKKKCPICGIEKNVSTGFYKSSSPLYSEDGCVPICTSCVKNGVINKEDGTINIKKMKTMLQRIDKPFYIDDLDSSYKQYKKEHGFLSDDEIAKHGKDIIGIYFKNCMLRQNRNKSFSDSEKDGFIHQNSNSIKSEKERIINTYIRNMGSSEGNFLFEKDKLPEIKQINEKKTASEIKWNKKDKQNMKYVISTVGYDPFEDLGLSEYDKKYCFNILAGYCDTPGISEDGHKMHSVVEITVLYAQCRRITEEMNNEFNKSDVDDTKISKLSSSKSTLLSSISKIAQDNNISSNYNKNSKQGQDSLSSKMKEMEENGFSEIEVNLFDIKTSEAFKQIDQISNENIANQLTLDSNEYTDIIKEQRELITTYESQLDELNEENRMLKNKIIDLETHKR